VARGHPAIEAIGEVASVPLATIYRLFGSKRGDPVRRARSQLRGPTYSVTQRPLFA